MESNVLKAVEEISGYTPDEMIAMYNDYGRMAKEWEAYASAGLSPEVCAEYRKFEDEVVASGMTFGEVVELMHKERTRWIPVSERLPEKDGFYNVVMNGGVWGEPDVWSATSCGFYDGMWDEDGTTITHWMPLPEAPKEAANG